MVSKRKRKRKKKEKEKIESLLEFTRLAKTVATDPWTSKEAEFINLSSVSHAFVLFILSLTSSIFNIKISIKIKIKIETEKNLPTVVKGKSVFAISTWTKLEDWLIIKIIFSITPFEVSWSLISSVVATFLRVDSESVW